jgi:hypothetical protein
MARKKAKAKRRDEELEWVYVEHVIVPEGRRKLNESVVQALTESMAAYGLQTPITVRILEETVIDGREWVGVPVLIAGGHRLEAARRLGWERIDAIVVEYDDLRRAELWEIDENLCRSVLSSAEYSAAIVRRKALYEELHPETRHGGDRKSGAAKSSHQVEDLIGDRSADTAMDGDAAAGEEERKSSGQVGRLIADRFTKDTAEKTGRSERSVQRAAHRGEAIAPDVLRAIQGTRLDTGSYQDRIARLDHDEQRKTVQEDLAAPPSSQTRPPKQMSAWPEGEESARRIAQMVAENIPEDDWDEFGYHLGKTTPTRITQALARIAVRSEAVADWGR